MTEAPPTPPSWLLKMTSDIATISANTDNQATLIDKVEDWVKELDDEVGDLGNAASVMHTKMKVHIRDEARHTSPGEMEEVVDKELQKYGVLNKQRQWIDNHQVISTTALMSILLGAFELIKSGAII